VADGEIDLDVAWAGGEGAEIASGDDGARESGFVPVEVELIAWFAAGERNGLGCPLGTAGENFHALRDLDVQLRGEAIGHEAGGGEPACRVEQICDRLLNRSELEAFDRAVLIAGDNAFVVECPVVGLASGEGFGGGDANGAVGETLTGEQLAGVVGNFVDLESGMKAEADLVGAFGRGEGDLGLGSDVMGGRVKLGVDDVAGDIECGALSALSREGHGGEQGGDQGQTYVPEATGWKIEQNHWLSELHIVFLITRRFGWRGFISPDQDCTDSATGKGMPR
jgi:hypothetical protein